ncbi:MAG: methyltransferase regulatory domain-containing protein [Acidobacteriota bacterium]
MTEDPTRPGNPGAPAAGRPAGDSYDAVPYESHAISDTDPDALATMGVLFGLRPAAVETCRVLELGCAGAGNLVAMALPLPRARFVGVDASPQQIEAGRALARQVGVENVALTAGDLKDLPAGLPEFDYIVCHGVYSWVEPAVQEKILEIFGTRLAPQGIAYLSYNAYPGSHLRAMAREMMRFHVRNIADPAESTSQARALLEFLKRFARGRKGPYEGILEYLNEHLVQEPDWYVFHEYLEEHNQPVYFSDLVSRAERHGLQYLAPARFVAWENNLPPELEESLGKLSNRVVREQYLDFLCNRMFRRTLFCRAGAPIAQRPRPEAVAGLQAVGRARPAASNPDVRSDREEEFCSPAQERFATSRPLVKAALTVLAEETPRAMSPAALWPKIAARLEGAPDAAAGPEELAGALLEPHLRNAVALRTWSPPLVLSPGERPEASPLARLQASRDEPIVNLRHETVVLADLDEVVLPLLDGTRDRSELREAVVAAVVGGRLGIEDKAGARLEDPEKMREVVASALEECLARLAAACLLRA